MTTCSAPSIVQQHFQIISQQQTQSTSPTVCLSDLRETEDSVESTAQLRKPLKIIDTEYERNSHLNVDSNNNIDQPTIEVILAIKEKVESGGTGASSVDQAKLPLSQLTSPVNNESNGDCSNENTIQEKKIASEKCNAKLLERFIAPHVNETPMNMNHMDNGPTTNVNKPTNSTDSLAEPSSLVTPNSNGLKTTEKAVEVLKIYHKDLVNWQEKLKVSPSLSVLDHISAEVSSDTCASQCVVSPTPTITSCSSIPVSSQTNNLLRTVLSSPLRCSSPTTSNIISSVSPTFKIMGLLGPGVPVDTVVAATAIAGDPSRPVLSSYMNNRSKSSPLQATEATPSIENGTTKVFEVFKSDPENEDFIAKSLNSMPSQSLMVNTCGQHPKPPPQHLPHQSRLIVTKNDVACSDPKARILFPPTPPFIANHRENNCDANLFVINKSSDSASVTITSTPSKNQIDDASLTNFDSKMTNSVASGSIETMLANSESRFLQPQKVSSQSNTESQMDVDDDLLMREIEMLDDKLIEEIVVDHMMSECGQVDDDGQSASLLDLSIIGDPNEDNKVDVDAIQSKQLQESLIRELVEKNVETEQETSTLLRRLQRIQVQHTHRNLNQQMKVYVEGQQRLNSIQCQRFEYDYSRARLEAQHHKLRLDHYLQQQNDQLLARQQLPSPLKSPSKQHSIKQEDSSSSQFPQYHVDVQQNVSFASRSPSVVPSQLPVQGLPPRFNQSPTANRSLFATPHAPQVPQSSHELITSHLLSQFSPNQKHVLVQQHPGFVSSSPSMHTPVMNNTPTSSYLGCSSATDLHEYPLFMLKDMLEKQTQQSIPPQFLSEENKERVRSTLNSLYYNLRHAEEKYDSDATESSTGGDSDDDFSELWHDHLAQRIASTTPGTFPNVPETNGVSNSLSVKDSSGLASSLHQQHHSQDKKYTPV